MKEWCRVSRAGDGKVVVTVTVVEENLSVRWSVKCFRAGIVAAVGEARRNALACLSELAEAA